MLRKYSSSYQKLFKAALATTLATGAFVAVAPASMNASEAGVDLFKDVNKNDHFYGPILDLTSRGIIQGFGDGTYKPYNTVTRGQAAKILALTLGLDTKNVKNPGFTDVKVTDEYYGPIAALVEAGIVKGYDDKSFKPGNQLTRAQMAKIITVGFGLKEEKLTDAHFKDVDGQGWYADFVQSLITNNITTGTTPTTFGPNAFVTRGQMASFVARSEAAVLVKSKIVNITSDSIELSAGTYSLPTNLKGFFNETNLATLKDAVLEYTIKDGAIVKVNSIEITTSGSITEKAVLDGRDSTFTGSVKVNGNNVSLKSLRIRGYLEIGVEVKNSFNADKITVEGKTLITDSAASKVAVKVSSQFAFNTSAIAAATTAPTITFSNSTMDSVEITKKEEVVVEAKGTTKLKEFILVSNAHLKADPGISIPKVNVKEGATKVTLDASVDNLSVNTPKALTIDGSGHIKNVTLESSNDVKLETKGKIDKVDVKSKDSRISIGAETKVGNLVLPEGAKAQDIVRDFEKVTENIGNIGGNKNPDSKLETPVTPPSSGDNANHISEQQKLNDKVVSLISDINTREGEYFTISSPTANSLKVVIKKDQPIGEFLGRGFYTSFVNGLGVSKIDGYAPFSADAIGSIAILLNTPDELNELKGKTITIPLTVNNGSDLTVNFKISFEN